MIQNILKRVINQESTTIGLAPGTIASKSQIQEIQISTIAYNEDFAKQEDLIKIQQNLEATSKAKIYSKLSEELSSLNSNEQVNWININGLDPDLIRKVGEVLNIHPLVLEDIAHANQRPKLEDHDDHIYVVLKMLMYDNDKNEIKQEQISFILGAHYLISFQEFEGDVFNLVRNRILQNKGRVRKMGADYLMYCLLDSIVDNYFAVLHMISEEIEEIEKSVEKASDQESYKKIHKIRQEITFLRKYTTPLKELVNNLIKSESVLIGEPIIIYLKDLKDHTLQVTDALEMLRDLITNSLEIYLSSLNNKMNDVMKVLTIMSSIFIPLTFIAGIYGMNFQYMPELSFKWAYPTVLGTMLIVALIMILIFKKKRWF